MQWFLWVILAIYVVASLLCILAIVRGPSSLDRIVASDVYLSATVVLLVSDMAINRHTDTLAVSVILTLFAMVATVAVAKFMGKQDA